MSFLKRLKDKFQPKTDQPQTEEQESLESQSEALDDGLISIEEFEEWEQEQARTKGEIPTHQEWEKVRSAWAQQSASLGSGVEELGLPLQQYWSACQQGYRCHLEKNATQMAAISWRLTPVYCDEHCSGKFFGGGGRECPPPPL